MQFELIPLERAKAMARVSSMDDAQEAAIKDILNSVTKTEGIFVKFDAGEKITTMRSRFAKVAKAEGMHIVCRAAKGGMVVWQS